ncbi:MAG: hypothetical protein GC200_04755 [Tepidisphaera sp.]|nr:hypothetical protein [Tepidisphaera sp.]
MKSVIVSVGVVACAQIVAATPVQWATGAGATNKLYERIDTQGHLTWQQANAAAASHTFNGFHGRLVIFNGSNPVAEQAWVRDNVVHPGLGGNQTIYWTGATRPNNSGDRTMNWVWEDGSAVPTSVTTTWNIDWNEGAGAYAEGFHNNYGFDFGDYRQDDPANRMGGYIIEYPPAAGSPCGSDINRDGVVDQGDVDYLVNVIAGGQDPLGIDADFNQDGVADQGDVDALINVIAGGDCP